MRCDKQQPQCSRCIRIGSSCRYSVSMRTGKPTIDFVKALNAGMLLMPPNRPAQTTTQGTGALDSDQSFRAILQAGRSRSSRSTTKSSTPPASDSVPSPVLVGQFQDRDLSLDREPEPRDSSSPFSAMPATQNYKMGLQSGQSTGFSSHNPIDVTNIMDYSYMSADDFTLPGVESHSPDFSLSVPPAMDFDYFSQYDLSDPEPSWISEMTTPSSIGQGTNESTIPVDPALQQPHAPLYGHDCLRTTKTLQASVIMMTSRGETMQRELGTIATTPPVTTIDQAFLMCSRVSKQLIEILRCRCEADAYLPFLIAVIISKLLATYGAIAKVDDSTPFNFGSIQKFQKEQEQRQDAFVAVPLRLGAYDVDGEVEGVLRAQLVLHELSKLECVVQLFAEKYCQGGGDEKSSEDRTIYSALGQFIKHRCARTKEACELRSPLQTLRL